MQPPLSFILWCIKKKKAYLSGILCKCRNRPINLISEVYYGFLVLDKLQTCVRCYLLQHSFSAFHNVDTDVHCLFHQCLKFVVFLL